MSDMIITIQSTSVTPLLFFPFHVSVTVNQFINLSHLRKCGSVLDMLNSQTVRA